jgi:hypothetical protein
VAANNRPAQAIDAFAVAAALRELAFCQRKIVGFCVDALSLVSRITCPDKRGNSFLCIAGRGLAQGELGDPDNGTACVSDLSGWFTEWKKCMGARRMAISEIRREFSRVDSILGDLGRTVNMAPIGRDITHEDELTGFGSVLSDMEEVLEEFISSVREFSLSQ